MEQGLELV